jgi:hypothetical protein
VLGLAIALHSDVALERIGRQLPPLGAFNQLPAAEPLQKRAKTRQSHAGVAKSTSAHRSDPNDNIADVLNAKQRAALQRQNPVTPAATVIKNIGEPPRGI